MYCKQCNVLVKGANHICPLCHGEMEKGEFYEETSYLEQTYIKEKINGKKLFRRIYAFCAIDITIIFSIVAAVFLSSKLYPLLVAGIFLYVFLLIDNTILGGSKVNTGKRIFAQNIFLAVLCLIIQLVFPPKTEWAITYAIPIITIISTIVLGIFSLIKVKRNKSYLLSFVGLATLGVLPILTTWISPEISLYWPTLVSFIVSIIILSTLLFFRGKDLLSEIRKKIHF